MLMKNLILLADYGCNTKKTQQRVIGILEGKRNRKKGQKKKTKVKIANLPVQCNVTSSILTAMSRTSLKTISNLTCVKKKGNPRDKKQII